jgi:hypothetical protein
VPTIANGVLDFGGCLVGGSIYYSNPAFAEEGKRYLIKIVVDSMTTGDINALFYPHSNDGGFSENFGRIITEPGTYYDIIETDADSNVVSLKVRSSVTDAIVSEFSIYPVGNTPWTDLSTLDVTRNHIQWALIGDSQFSDMALPYDGTYVVHVYPLGHTLGIAASYKSDGFLPDPDPDAGEIRITVEQYLGRKTIVSLQNMEV